MYTHRRATLILRAFEISRRLNFQVVASVSHPLRRTPTSEESQSAVTGPDDSHWR